jgi:site-specific recombinase XerD
VIDLSRELVKDFLDHLEENRKCSVRTRNQRLAALHAMARFISERSPEHIAWCAQVRSVPFKHFARKELSYLEKSEVAALLATPDLHSRNGIRDHALLLFLCNSGARVIEAASLRVVVVSSSSSSDLSLRANQIGSVQLKGKGNKTRTCQLWLATCDELLAINRPPDASVS